MKISRFLTVVFTFFLTVTTATAREVIVSSPDGTVRLTVSDIPHLQYSIAVDGKTRIQPSEIGVETDSLLYGGQAKIEKVIRSSADRIIKADVYKKSVMRDCYNEAVIHFGNFSLIARAYDDGCAWRFVSNSTDSVKVRNEKWDVRLPYNSPMWINYSNVKGSIQAQFGSSQENTYSHCKVKDWNPEKIAVTPLLIEQDICLTLAESDVIDYPGLYFINDNGSQSLKALFPPVPDNFDISDVGITKKILEKASSVRDYIAECPAGFTFPWRIVGVNRTAASLLESDMIQRLARPASDVDWSWVKPGKAAWDWWCASHLDGVGFKPGFNTATYKYFIDFASEYGLEYLIMDGGWSVREAADLMAVVPDIDLKEVISYAEKKGVGIILWAGFVPFRDKMEEVCRHYSRMGVKGFKVDFHNRDDQTMMRYYRQAAETCAKYKLIIEFHGCSKPTGLQRTYPNIVNIEAVYGLEMTKFQQKDPVDFVTNEVTIPFTRMYAGPLDYTPGALQNASWQEFRYNHDRPMSQGTRCRQLAEYVVLFAPLQMLCDSPTSYQKEAECTEFISKIPVVWDETVALGGKVGEYVALARRCGDVWYVAAMNGWKAAKKEIVLDFLPGGSYRLEVMQDAASSTKCPEDYIHEVREVSSGEHISAELSPGGGYVARISPVR